MHAARPIWRQQTPPDPTPSPAPSFLFSIPGAAVLVVIPDFTSTESDGILFGGYIQISRILEKISEMQSNYYSRMMN